MRKEKTRLKMKHGPRELCRWLVTHGKKGSRVSSCRKAKLARWHRPREGREKESRSVAPVLKGKAMREWTSLKPKGSRPLGPCGSAFLALDFATAGPSCRCGLLAVSWAWEGEFRLAMAGPRLSSWWPAKQSKMGPKFGMKMGLCLAHQKKK